MAYQYDEENIFAKILRGEIPNDTVLETEHSLAFRDINPQAPDHVMVIPKGPYVCFDHFANSASDAEIIDWHRAVGKVIDLLGASLDKGAGYRTIANAGDHGHQDVPHFHMHILAGRRLGPMLLHAS